MRRQDVQLFRVCQVLPRIVLGYLVGGAACGARFMLQPVFATLFNIILEMPDVGDVAHHKDIVPIVLKHAAQPVRCHEGTEVANMNIPVNRWAAGIHAHARRMKRREQVFTSRQRIIEVNWFCRCCHHEQSSSSCSDRCRGSIPRAGIFPNASCMFAH